MGNQSPKTQPNNSKLDALGLLGPLAPLVGIWEGDKGVDTAPSKDRGKRVNEFRERITFEPIAPTRNHEQLLGGLRYFTEAWPAGGSEPFHQETGYWLWDGGAKQVMRCFVIPRGTTILAGGTAESDASTLLLSAKSGDEVYGISSNPFLEREFKTIRFSMKLVINGESFSYEQDSELKIKGQLAVFHHTDSNTLWKK